MILSGTAAALEVAIRGTVSTEFCSCNGSWNVGVSRLGSRDGPMSRWRGRPPDSSREWAAVEMLGSAQRPDGAFWTLVIGDEPGRSLGRVVSTVVIGNVPICCSGG